jgi:hypothetical protein
MSSRFSEAFVMRLAAANGIDDATPVTPLDGTEAAQVATFKTVPVWVKDLDAFSIHFSTVGGSTLAGTITLQASNDRSNKEQTGQADAGTVANWVAISLWDWAAGAQAANKAVVSGANQILIGDRVCGYRWLQLVFTFTSGSGSPKLTFQQKGVS